MRRYFLIAIFILSLALTWSVRSCYKYQEDRDRLSDNQRTLLSDIDFYRTKDSLSVAGVERLTLSNREFEKYCGNLEKQVKDLGLKVKRLQAVSQSATDVKYVITTEVRDSVLPGRTDTLWCMDYQNAYLSFSGCLQNGRFSGIVESRDTIIQVVHRVPRKFLFIRWGTKAIRQEIISKNPYSRITYTNYIELKK